MTADIKPYPVYKDSGVSWLGQVPEHWGLWSLRAIANVEKGRLPRNLLESGRQPEESVPYLSMSFLRSSTESASEYAAYQPDLVLVDRGETILLWDGANAGEFLKAKAGVVSSTAARVRPRAVDQQFFFYACRLVEPTLRALTVGMGIPHVDGDVLKGLRLPIPPTTEQVSIVRYLDHADRKVRHAIRARQQLIKLLTEQKQAIINRAVTRGLDPNVRLKPSGVPWLGDVPEHWEVLPIKRTLISLDYGISESSTDAGTIRLLTMGNIRDGRVTIPEAGGVVAVDASLLLEIGDLLFNRTNSSELVGKVGLFTGANSPVTFASYLVRMRPRPEYEPEYLNFVCNDVSTLSVTRREAIPSLHQSNLNPTRYGRLRIPLPPLQEQRTILKVLKKKTSNVDKAIDTAHREIDLLREYRTRLIADVVTGKLDVRDVKVPDDETYVLPEEIERIDDVDAIDQTDDVAESDSESSSEESA